MKTLTFLDCINLNQTNIEEFVMSKDNEAMLKVKEILFGEEVNSIEKKIDELANKANQYQEKEKIKRESIDKKFSNELQSLKASLSKSDTKFTNEILTSNTKISAEINELRNQSNKNAKELSKELQLLKEELQLTIKKAQERSSAELGIVKQDYVSKELLSETLLNLARTMSPKKTPKKIESTLR